MARKFNEALWTLWRQRIDRQRESGLSIVEFCRRENVSPQGFHLWKRKLRRATAARHPAAEARGLPSASSSPVVMRGQTRTGQFEPNVPGSPADFLRLPLPSVRPKAWVELALADGTVIRLPAENLAALVTVLRVLRGERLELPREEQGHA